LDPIARGNEPAHFPSSHPGQYEVLTNDEPRHPPARPETRPNQRLCVSPGSPPSVAVSSLSTRAAHRSCAPQIERLGMTLIATSVKVVGYRKALLARSTTDSRWPRGVKSVTLSATLVC
jgi:hypothetical protein